MSEYLIINISTILFPLLYSFESTINYFRKLPAVIVSTIIVGVYYVVWDVIATSRGDWSFNADFLLGIDVFNLPLEEIFFFITVPYSMIFLYEISKYYFTKKEIKYNPKMLLIVAVVFFIVSIINYDQDYTFTVMFTNGILFSLIAFSQIDILFRLQFWIYMLLAFIPFFLVNYFLTSLPVVIYGTESIFNIRITTIPLEDFFYNFSLVFFYVYVYEFLQQKVFIKGES